MAAHGAELLETLTPYQRGLLETVQRLHTEPITTKPPGTTRSEEQVQASVQIHKRINPGYVEAPYTSTSASAFKYLPAPDFTRDHLRTSSDCRFQEYAAECILKHVDLKKARNGTRTREPSSPSPACGSSAPCLLGYRNLNRSRGRPLTKQGHWQRACVPPALSRAELSEAHGCERAHEVCCACFESDLRRWVCCPFLLT